jgi:undecaprenyl-diphosphatase
MTYLDAIILGILQGLTEFLPVSSSGHLVLAKALLNVTQPGLSFEIMVHLGTLLSVLFYFRKSCSFLRARYCWPRGSLRAGLSR